MKNEEQVLDLHEISATQRKWSLFKLRLYTIIASGVVALIFFRILYIFVSP
jgi:hypothetical protein